MLTPKNGVGLRTTDSSSMFHTGRSSQTLAKDVECYCSARAKFLAQGAAGASRITSDVQLYVHARGPAPTMMTTEHLNIGLQLHKMISIAYFSHYKISFTLLDLFHV